ncbi:MAG: adenylate/guanylate cyclase domain-containing protein [Nitrosopumilaceae archaeon]|nr:adenylate/guanylate cyclase domain-containing protein [Nitrosopumilaceae archaeon]NIU01768.1 adenylate/guanylate cyclase domain-containing protein [Nitrosopumilaceae archaeon]NIU88168.1 adenylate/guanylate cyclase domain-containing protein [Nitrosopumilaceae archaeon]NIV66491.1 adenylate/guanylate cyclase domain-containing protein [Nitrosopumilaceae archaeon]NIX62370.1 adenylate/guanylate cyclase domain-containing protein [Nitrosopumilaceae archaeon]
MDKPSEQIAKQGLENILSENPNIIDVLLGRENLQIVNSDKLVEEVQKRIWGALKNDFQYSNVTKTSDEFLRKNVFSSIPMSVLYVDLVGSTQMVMNLPRKQLAAIITSFAQEMAYVIKRHNGLVLKFVGDAVIGYFPEKEGIPIADIAVTCAESMIKVVKLGINPLLKQYDYPDLQVKIGIDYGENTIIRYGNDEKESHVDLLGSSMNMAAKIQGSAFPDQILIGEDVYKKLQSSIKEYFSKFQGKNTGWNYKNKTTGKVYSVYAYIGK